MARKYFIIFNWRSHTRHLSFLDLCSTTDETLESSLGKKCFSSFKLLNGGLYGVWYHNLALTERFLAWSLLEVHWRSTWSLFEVLLMNSEVHEVSSIKSEYWKLQDKLEFDTHSNFLSSCRSQKCWDISPETGLVDTWHPWPLWP